MNNNKIFPDSLIKYLSCPQCGAQSQSGFDANQLKCGHCNASFFTLGNTPCLFPTGQHQLLIWQHQTAVLKNMAEQALASIRESLARYDISDKTRKRLAEIYDANLINLESIVRLLDKKGIGAVANEGLANAQLGDLSEYFDLIFRDWAWDSTAQPNNENKKNLGRIENLLQQVKEKPARVLVLGSGAGRLSWDIHQSIKPEFTISLDSNPLLLAVKDEIINEEQSVSFGEFKLFPQIDLPVSATRILNPPQDLESKDNWISLGANAWQLPLAPGSMDLIITPWFIDVNGGDLRDLIGIISNILTPGGYWLNTGPLLFTRHLPLQLKYSDGEIREFLGLAQFEIQEERVDIVQHLDSPLEARGREEQVWTFVAQKTLSDPAPAPGVPNNWLVLHHLPIPLISYKTNESNPFLEVILELVDGKRSINDICQILAPHIPEGLAVKDVVIAILGQIFTEKENQ